MQFKSILATTTVLILTAASQATTFTWTGADPVTPTAWHDRDNWDLGTVPGSSDTAVIPNVTNDPVLATSTTVAILQINSGGFLTIDATSGTATLTVTATDGAPFAGDVDIASDGAMVLSGSSSLALTGSIDIASGGTLTISGAGMHDVDGPINVAGTFNFTSTGTVDVDSTVALTSTGTFNVTNASTVLVDATGILDIDGVVNLTGGPAFTVNGFAYLAASAADLNVQSSSVTFSGTGYVVGEHQSAGLNIATGLVLTNQLNIEGRMTINGPGTLDNDDYVIANAAGPLTLASNLVLANGSSGFWHATTNPSAILQFNASHTGANRVGGSMLVNNCATIDFNDVAIEITGTFTGTSGFLTDGTGSGTFSYSCPSPCTPVDLPEEYGSCD